MRGVAYVGAKTIAECIGCRRDLSLFCFIENMQRFYLPNIEFGTKLTITDTDLLHQLQRVLRIKIGQRVLFFGEGTNDKCYQLDTTNAKEAVFSFVEEKENALSPKRNLTVLQALPNKIEKIEWILQKGVEIGVAHFVFFRSEHSQDLSQLNKKMPRLSLIMQEALEQCGGNMLPILEFVSTAPKVEKNDIVLDPLGEQSFLKGAEMIATSKSVRFWVGPEGGWSEKERQDFLDSGALCCTFGKRILRTETASIVASFYLLLDML